MSIRSVDRAYLDINGGRKICNSLDEDIDPDVKPIEGMTSDNRILGHSQGNLKIKLTAEIAMDADDDTDFKAMAANKEEFSAGVEYEGGGSTTYIDVVVSKAAISSKTGQHTTWKLDLSARDFVDG